MRRTEDGGTWIARWRVLALGSVAPERAFDTAGKAATAWFKKTDTEAGRCTVKDAAPSRTMRRATWIPGAWEMGHRPPGPRSVPLSNAAAQLFDRRTKAKLPAAYLLTCDDGQPWQHSDQDKLMREVVRKAKLPHGTVYYTLRHTFIASALSNDIDIHNVADLCGTSIPMIEKHSGKLLHSDARATLYRIAFV